jgi:deoxyribose-phosphate aldolase
MHDLAGNKEYSLLNPGTSLHEVEQLCEMAIEHRYAAVNVPPLFVKKAKELSAASGIKIATVIGFPFGYSAVEAKLAEIVLAIVDGADELDIVINIAALKSNDWQYLARELNHIMPVVKGRDKILKVIIEAGLLTSDELMKCCDIYGIAGVDYIQSATGYSAAATTGHVRLIRKYLANAVKIKVVSDKDDDDLIHEWLLAGADRIGIIK